LGSGLPTAQLDRFAALAMTIRRRNTVCTSLGN
jgi:hypothetical protein